MYRFDIAAQVDRGPVRGTTQDVASVAPQLGLVVVADGMDQEGWDTASGFVAVTAIAAYERMGGLDTDVHETARRLIRACEEAKASMRSHLIPNRAARTGMRLVTVALGSGHAVVAHAGDSRCYLLRDRSTECVTHGQSRAAELHGRPLDRRAGMDSQCPPPQARCHGEADEVFVCAKVLPLQVGDALVLCSDGLWGGVACEAIERIVAAADSAADACAALIAAAWKAGGLDNIGVAVIRVLAEKPVCSPSAH